MTALHLKVVGAELLIGEGSNCLPSLLPHGGSQLAFAISALKTEPVVNLTSRGDWNDLTGVCKINLKHSDAEDGAVGWAHIQKLQNELVDTA